MKKLLYYYIIILIAHMETGYTYKNIPGIYSTLSKKNVHITYFPITFASPTKSFQFKK